MTAADVTACLVTRGDVDLQPILDHLIFPNVIVWNNNQRENRKVYGRYEAARLADTPLVYFQDDDVLVTEDQQRHLLACWEPGTLVTNQAIGHQTAEFSELTFVGWGAISEQSLPGQAHATWAAAGNDTEDEWFLLLGCDIVFSMLTPTRVLDLGQNHRDFAYNEDRLHATPDYVGQKRRFYQEALALRFDLAS